MTEREQINVSLDNRLSRLETKFELFMQESQQQREDIRRLHERQDAERARFDAEMKEFQKKQDAAQAKRDAEFKEFQKKHDADMRDMNKKIDSKFDKLSEQIHTMTIAAVVGFGAIAAAVGGLVFAAFR